MAELLGEIAQPSCLLRLGKDLAAFSDEDPASAAALEQSFPDEFLVGAGDGIGVDDEGLRESADRGKLVADGEGAHGHGALNLVHDLPENGHIAGGRDGEGQ